MVYTYYNYSSLQDSITSICKTILPLKNKKRLQQQGGGGAEEKQQSDNLKWQQNSFHQILNLIGLEKEGIVPHTHVSAYRSQLLDTLVASQGIPHHEPSPILRDKLLFLQELLYAKCISAEEYHASKRPLLQRLAVQGAEIDATDVILGSQKVSENSQEDQWSVIDLRDDQTLLNKPKNQSKLGSSAMKQIKDAATVLGFGFSQKHTKNKQQRSIFDLPTCNNPHPVNIDHHKYISTHERNIETRSILMSEGLASDSDNFDKGSIKRDGNEEAHNLEEIDSKSTRKFWGGLKRWKRSHKEEDETTPLPLRETSRPLEGEFNQLLVSPVGQGPDTKLIKTKLLSDASASSGFFIDKVLGDNIKKELSRIQTQLSSSNPNFNFSNDQMDAISTKLPVDKTDLKQFFPKSWCDRYGDVVLNVVKKEFQEHVGEMENTRNATLERRHTNSKRWTTFEDDENCHPNQFAALNHTLPLKKQSPFTSSVNVAEW